MIKSERDSHVYILEVDLEYSDELDKSHNAYPLVPKKPEISCSILSKYCSDLHMNKA